MAVGPIPWTAIQKYIEVSGMFGEEAWFFEEIISHLDAVFLEHQNKKS